MFWLFGTVTGGYIKTHAFWYNSWYTSFVYLWEIEMPKIVTPLTYRAVMAISKEGFTALGGAVGLYLLVKPSKRKYYVYRYKDHTGKRSMISLGPVELLDLAQARALATDWRIRLRDGISPSDVRQAERKERRKNELEARIEREKLSHLFQDVAAQWIKERAESGFWAKNARGEAEHQSLLDRFVFPTLGLIPISKVTPNDVFEMIKPIYQEKPSTADKTLTDVSSIWKWAEARGWVSGDNPANRQGTLGVLLEPYKDRKKQENYPALAFSDVPAFMKELHAYDTIAARMLEFAILTTLRSKMVRYLKWDDIDWDNKLATIYESSIKTKGRGKHTVFLSNEAIALLKSVPPLNEWVFPSPRINKPMSDAAMGKVFDVLHDKNVAEGGCGWIDPEQTKEKGYPVGATAHGTCRASFKTWARTGENRKLLDDEAVELCMAHKLKDDYAGAYNRAELEDERREVMQAWGSFCYSKIG